MQRFYLKLMFVLVPVFFTLPSSGQRIMEKLGRGLVATRTSTAKVLVSWRLLGTEPQSIGFNVYRSSGGTPVKLNSSVLQAGTNFEDVSASASVANTYYVKTVINDAESELSAGYTLPANTPVQPFYRVPIRNVPGYYVRYVFVGDLDGDGEFDYVINKQPISTQTLPDLVEGYKRDGTLLWTMDLGPNSTNRDNISPGSSALNCGHGDNITVFDINCDGKAEVIIRTANGVKFADGTTISDSNNSRQFLSVVNGSTGVEISRTVFDNPYLNIGPMNGHMGIAYLDGVHPSVVWESANRSANGNFNEMVTSWDWNGSSLIYKWRYDITNKSIPSGHQFKIFDIDGDGKDEVIPQGYALDDNGTLMYNLLDQSIDHGDRFFISDMDPSRPGLEMYGIQQGYSKAGIQWYYLDAKTGKILLSQSSPDNPDMARGMVGDLDPRYDGLEFHTFVDGLYNVSGAKTSNGTPSSYPNLRFFWDGDLLSENLDNMKFTKWNYLATQESRLYTASGVLQVARNVPVFYGDLVGDWREEVVYESADHNNLVIYTSPYFTINRIYTLAHNPGYRSDMAVRGYYQSHMPDFFIGNNMQVPPLPPIQRANKYWVGNTSSWDKSLLNWTDGTNQAAFADGDTIMFDIRGNNADTIRLAADVTPARVLLTNPDNKNYIVTGPGKLKGTMDAMKTSKGSFTIIGDHEYTGNTEISEGTMNIDGSLKSKIIVKPMGALGGRGVLHAGLVLEKAANTDGGRLNIGMGASASLLGSLTVTGDLLANGNNFQFDVIPGSRKVNDSLIVTGNANFSGANKLIINFANNTFVAGIYTLISCKGTLTASPENFTIQGVDGISKSLIIENNEIKLKINSVRNPASIVWTGADDNIWNFDNPNFNSKTGAVSFVSKDSVLFDATSPKNSIVLTETVYPALLTFDSGNDYTIQGSGSIAGETNITKDNNGTLSLLNGSNSYTGKTIVNGGKLSIASLALADQPSSLGSAGVNPANIQLNNANLVVNNTSTTDRGLTLSGSSTITVPQSKAYTIFLGDITGSGGLTKEGDGAIFMVGAKTFSGPVVIKSGTVNLRTVEGNTNGLGSSKEITLENATLSMEDVRNYAQASWNLTVPAGKNAYLNTDGRSTLLGALKGSGTLNVYIPYVRTDFKGKWSQFSGQVNLSGSDFRIGNGWGYANASISLNSGAIYTISGASSTISFGAFSGAAGTSINSANWVIGAKNTDGKYSGNILGSSLTKVGTGTLTLDGNNTFAGGTTISEGRVLVNNPVGKRGLGTGVVSVANGAVLGGTGGVRGAITISTGGALQPGSGGIGTFIDSTSVTFADGAIAEMEISRSNQTKDVLKVLGKISYAGKLVIKETNNAAFSTGDSFKLFDASTYSGNFSSIDPLIPGPGMFWKFDPATGTLSVEDDSTLPVGLLSFNVRRNYNSVEIKWITSSEVNNDHYQLERSLDGKRFLPLTTIKGAGNSASRKEYKYIDETPAPGENYYQLQQTDLDGTTKLVGVRMISFGDFGQGELKAYPNPFSASFSIQLPKGVTGPVTVNIVSMEGKEVEMIKTASEPSGICKITTSKKLPAGPYLVIVSGANFHESLRVLVN